MTLPFSHEEMLFLSRSDEFQRILSADARLDALDAEQYDRAAEIRILSDTLGISGKPFFTVGKWALLWILDSPYVRGGNVSLQELQEARFVLYAEKLPRGTERIRTEAANIPLSGEVLDVHAEIVSAVREAFLPLVLLPPVGTRFDEVETRFDLDWLCRVCSIAARESGEPFTRCIHALPLSAVCSLFVNYRRRTSPDGERIGRRATPEIARAVMERTYVLGREYLDRRKKRKKAEKDGTFV